MERGGWVRVSGLVAFRVRCGRVVGTKAVGDMMIGMVVVGSGGERKRGVVWCGGSGGTGNGGFVGCNGRDLDNGDGNAAK